MDRAVQNIIDSHELRLCRVASLEVRVLATQLSGVGMDCNKDFKTRLQQLDEDLTEAQGLRDEYSILRSSYNQANTQTQLMTDLRDKFSLGADDHSLGEQSVSVISARSARQSARNAVPHHTLGRLEGGGDVPGDIDVHPHESHAFHAHFVMNIHHPNHQSLKAVVAEERLRRGEDAQRRTSSLGSDYRALCHADVRSSKLLYQTTNNLSALEIQLSEDNSREQDKARIVFVKMLRERLTKESGVLVEKAKIYSRMQQQEAQSERYLQHLEEAMAVLSATKGPVEAFDGGDDASDIVTNTRDEIEANVGALVQGPCGEAYHGVANAHEGKFR